jgi:hypothetical protein
VRTAGFAVAALDVLDQACACVDIDLSDPNIRVRDVAEMAGITERSAQRIIVEIEDDGYRTHAKIGRRSRYRVGTDTTFLHPLEKVVEVRYLLDVVRVDGDHGSVTERWTRLLRIVPVLLSGSQRVVRFGRTSRACLGTSSDVS